MDSALLHLDLVSEGFFMKTTEDNTRVKRVELLRNDLAIKMGLASRLNVSSLKRFVFSPMVIIVCLVVA